MNRHAHKCKQCKRAFNASKIDQKYCSHKCRQAAYRKRLSRSGNKKGGVCGAGYSSNMPSLWRNFLGKDGTGSILLHELPNALS